MQISVSAEGKETAKTDFGKNEFVSDSIVKLIQSTLKDIDLMQIKSITIQLKDESYMKEITALSILKGINIVYPQIKTIFIPNSQEDIGK
jgi:hypothetical protein